MTSMFPRQGSSARRRMISLFVSAPIGAPFARRCDLWRSRAMKPAIEIETAAARTVLVLLDRRIHHAVTPRRRYSSRAAQARVFSAVAAGAAGAGRLARRRGVAG